MQEEDPYRREPAAPAERGALRLGDEPLRFSTNRSERNSGPQGLGGWLIAVAVMLVWSLLFGMVNGGGMAAMLDSPELDAAKRAAIQIYIAVCGVSFALNLAALVLFFMKSPWFPRVFIGWLGIDLILTAIAVGLLTQASNGGFLGTLALIVIVRGLFWNGLWIAYAIMSDRVKNTFVARRN